MLVALSRRIEKKRHEGERLIFYCFRAYGGISLGRYLFVHREAPAELVRHELGHCRQSLLLGPAYLLVIGLPSLVWAALYPLFRRRRPPLDYFAFYTERWANRLAGLEPRRRGRPKGEKSSFS